MFRFVKKYKKIILLCIGCIVLAGSVFFVRTYVVQKTANAKRAICKDCNILLISLDTCGASHMSTYGYERETTPNLTALANTGVLFANSHANANWTLPSHVSMFTGLYPFVHNVVLSYDTFLRSDIPLLPEVLQTQGYETVFFAPQDETSIAREHVYSRGVSYWDNTYWEYRLKEKEYFTLALNKLEENAKLNKKTFLFYHTFACHSPYLTEDEPLLYTENTVPDLPLKDSEIFNAPFTPEYYQFLLTRLPQGVKDDDFKIAPTEIHTFLQQLQNAGSFAVAEAIYERAKEKNFWGETRFNDYEEDFRYWDKINMKKMEDILFVRAIYDQVVHKVDYDLFATLREVRTTATWKNNTIVIITADHGEEFMEHDYFSHKTLYEFNTHVPFVMLIPGVTKRTIQEHVQSVDITPTILDIVGIQHAFAFNGTSVLPLVFGGSLGNRLILAEGQANAQPNILTIREGDWKVFVYKNTDGTLLPYEFYNTKKDPAEQTNILGENIDRAKAMITRYRSLKEKSFLMK